MILEKKTNKKRKKGKKNKKCKKEEEEKCTVDYCCNPQWFWCGGTMIHPHYLKVLYNKTLTLKDFTQWILIYWRWLHIID